MAIGAARKIAATMGWPLAYTLGVLGSWKMAPVYCEGCELRFSILKSRSGFGKD